MSKPKTVSQIRGALSNERGKRNEARVLSAAQATARGMTWCFSARMGTPEEDARGIDVVVDTDVGKLFLQVKSSIAQARAFEAVRRREVIKCIVAHPDDRRLGLRVAGTLANMRADILRERREMRGRAS